MLRNQFLMRLILELKVCDMKLDDNAVFKLKEDFPLLQKRVNGNQIIYLDNAATSQKPNKVIDSVSEYYKNNNANIHRGIYTLSEDSTKDYEDSKIVVAKFINAQPEEIIYTRNTTESINLVAYSLGFSEKLNKMVLDGKNEIVLSELEHHSNMVPWQQLAQRLGMKVRYLPLNSEFLIDLDDAKDVITEKTAILAITHISNALGTIVPVNELVKLASSKGAFTIVDAAQSAPHKKIDVKDIDCDFLAFSSHKMVGPMGIGVLFGKKELLDLIPPFIFGGDMISNVTYNDAKWNSLPTKFEGGTPNVADAVGLVFAIEYLQEIGLENISNWEMKLAEYAVEQLSKIKGVKIFRAKNNFESDEINAGGIVSFAIEGVHHHDIASYLNDFGICIRVGHHCAMPLMGKLGVSGTSRISFYLYNTHADVDAFIEHLKGAIEMFSVKR